MVAAPAAAAPADAAVPENAPAAVPADAAPGDAQARRCRVLGLRFTGRNQFHKEGVGGVGGLNAYNQDLIRPLPPLPLPPYRSLRLMDKILPYLKDPKLWELWYIPYNG